MPTNSFELLCDGDSWWAQEDAAIEAMRYQTIPKPRLETLFMAHGQLHFRTSEGVVYELHRLGIDRDAP